MWVSQKEIEADGHEIHDRFLKASNFPGTRENHAFILCDRGLQSSRISGVEIHYCIMFPAAAMTTMWQYALC